MGEFFRGEPPKKLEREPTVWVRELSTPDGRRLQALVQASAGGQKTVELIGFLGADEKTIDEIIAESDKARWQKFFLEHINEAGPAWDDFMKPYVSFQTNEVLERYKKNSAADYADYLERKARHAAEYARLQQEYPPYHNIWQPPPEFKEHQAYLAMLERRDAKLAEQGKELLDNLETAVSRAEASEIIAALAGIGRAVDDVLGKATSHAPGEVQPDIFWLTFGAATGGQRLLLNLNKSRNTLVFPAQGNLLSRHYQQALGRLFKPWVRITDGIPTYGATGELEPTYYVTIQLPEKKSA